MYEDAASAAETAAVMVRKSLSWIGVCDPQQTGSQKILCYPLLVSWVQVRRKAGVHLQMALEPLGTAPFVPEMAVLSPNLIFTIAQR